jgi:hypothetical protein
VNKPEKITIPNGTIINVLSVDPDKQHCEIAIGDPLNDVFRVSVDELIKLKLEIIKRGYE